MNEHAVLLGREHRSDMAEPTDKELLECARKGDAAALRTLIRRHDKYLYRVVRSVLADDNEAEDVIQETFIRAFRGLENFRGDANIRTWLTRIALNEAVRRRRRQRSTVDLGELHARDDRDPQQTFASSWRAPDSDPERAAARSQMRQILERAIDGLPAAFRTVLILRDVEELSVQQTAKLLGIRPETVRTRLHRARRFLREKLGAEFALALKDVFPFERPRCDALVNRVIEQLTSVAAR